MLLFRHPSSGPSWRLRWDFGGTGFDRRIVLAALAFRDIVQEVASTRVLAAEVDNPALARIGVDTVEDDRMTLPGQECLQKVPVETNGAWRDGERELDDLRQHRSRTGGLFMGHAGI
jgi:hypothetical protein